MPAATGLFSSASALDTYLASLTERLRSEREARIAFLAVAVNKLSPLLELAETLENEAVTAEISGHLSAARAELSGLRQQGL